MFGKLYVENCLKGKQIDGDKCDYRIKMGIIMSDIKYKKSHSLPKGAKPQIEITFIILTYLYLWQFLNS